VKPFSGIHVVQGMMGNMPFNIPLSAGASVGLSSCYGQPMWPCSTVAGYSGSGPTDTLAVFDLSKPQTVSDAFWWKCPSYLRNWNRFRQIERSIWLSSMWTNMDAWRRNVCIILRLVLSA